jgi:hypothetical protein
MTLASLWLPIILSAVFVFIASALINMLLKFWHAPDYRRFSNEDEIRAAIRNGNPEAPGQYALPWCTPEAMKDPAMQEKLRQGPVGMVYLRRPGGMNMGMSLFQWLLFCLLVSLFCALIAAHAVPPGANRHLVFHVTALAALMGHAFGCFTDGIWRLFPWKAAFKYIVDGIIYAIITGLTFVWLWPAA